MKKRTKILLIALCLIVFAAMALGSNSTSSGSGTSVDKEVASAGTPTSTDSDAGNEDNGNQEPTVETKTEITIEESVIFEEKGIKITTKALEDGLFGTKLTLLIENDSDKSVTVQTRDASVNGFMVTTMMSADVAAGKKANDEVTFMTSGLKECGIEQIAEMEFYFHIFDAETWDTIVDSEVIKIETSVASTYVQPVDDSGTVLVDTKDVKIVGKGLSENGSFWGPGVILYIENNSNKNITVQVRDVSVNDFMVTSTMSEDVVSGKKAMSAVQFFSTDLEDNSITDIEKVELYFHIFDAESWNTIFDSDVIEIAF